MVQICILQGYFFFFKQKTAYEMQRGLVGSEMCIRDRYQRRVHGVAAKALNTKFARVVYHWKIWETLLLDLLEILAFLSYTSPNQREAFAKGVMLIFIVFVRLAFGVYAVYTLFSFILLLDIKNNANLVQNGPDVVKLMEDIRKQAAAMERRTELSETEIAAEKPGKSHS
eukprot:TRINITY_DN31629_c0_g1_i1.p1 TRINITY_DN31629_c0_g1~~TRINITY_DN31629_c0_g1_i1.p1  ORF type:complete len:170 (+),score=47.82 TRINITY_DN31629_c0_g1_i1:24-533(+)